MGLRPLPPRRGMYTDESNFMLAVASSLAEHRCADASAIAVKCATFQFDETQPKRGTTYSTMRHLQRILDGWSVVDTGTSEFSEGKHSNGGAMRIGPVGVLYRTMSVTNDTLYECVRCACLATHVYPEALDAAFVVARCVSCEMDDSRLSSEFDFDALMLLCASGVKTEVVRSRISQVREYVRSNSLGDLRDVGSEAALRWMNEDLTFLRELLGENDMEFQIKARDAVATVLVAIGRYWKNPLLALQMAIGFGGDTDTIACMVGYVVGAIWGSSVLPAEWVSGLENGKRGRDYAIGLAEQLAAIREPLEPVVGQKEEPEEEPSTSISERSEEPESRDANSFRIPIGDPSVLLSREDRELYKLYLTQLLSIESVSTREQDILDFLMAEIETMDHIVTKPFRDDRMGVATVYDPDSLGEETTWRRKPNARPAILMCAHCDIVWDQGVITPKIDDESEEELGFGLIEATALDDKACCAVLLTLLRRAPFVADISPFIAFFSVQEEIGRNGARAFASSVDASVQFGVPVGSICVLDVTPGWITTGIQEGREAEIVGEMEDSRQKKAFERILSVWPQNPREGGWRPGTKRLFPLLGMGSFPTRQILNPFHLRRCEMLTDGMAFREFSSLYKSLPICYSGVPCIALHKEISFCSLRDCYQMLADIFALAIAGSAPVAPETPFDVGDLVFDDDDPDEDCGGGGVDFEEDDDFDLSETDEFELLDGEEELSPDTLAAIEREVEEELKREEEEES